MPALHVRQRDLEKEKNKSNIKTSKGKKTPARECKGPPMSLKEKKKHLTNSRIK